MKALRGVWLATGTPLGDRYPCRCGERSWKWCGYQGDPVYGWSWDVGCPCWGRTDLAGLTPACCGVRRYLGML